MLVLAHLLAVAELELQLRGELLLRAVRGRQVGVARDHGPLGGLDVRLERPGVAGRRVAHEVAPGDVDDQVAQPQRHAFDDLRQRIADDRDPRGVRGQAQRLPHHHVAEVVGTGDRVDHRDRPERAALVRAGEVQLAAQRQRVAARSGAGRHRADLAAGRARHRGDLRVGALLDALDLGRLAERQLRRQRMQRLVAVGPAQVERERRVLAGLRDVRRRDQTRSEREPVAAEHVERGPGVDRRGARPRREADHAAVAPAGHRTRQHGVGGVLELQLEVAERQLRVVVEDGGQLAGRSVGDHGADQADRDPVAVGVDEQPVAVARQRLADVRRPVERPVEQRRGDPDRRHPGSGRAGDRRLGALAELRVGAGLQAVGGRRVDRHAGRQRHRDPLDVRGPARTVLVLRDPQVHAQRQRAVPDQRSGRAERRRRGERHVTAAVGADRRRVAAGDLLARVGRGPDRRRLDARAGRRVGQEGRGLAGDRAAVDRLVRQQVR